MKKKYPHVIIVDGNNKPMSWDAVSGQLCHCTNSNWEDEIFPAEVYTVAKAKKLIKKSTEMRLKGKLSPSVYLTMPINKAIKFITFNTSINSKTK